MTIDIFAGSRNNGANVQLYRKNGTKAQQFKISSCGNGYYNISWNSNVLHKRIKLKFILWKE